MRDDGSPNILLVIWDACRADYAADHAPFLEELGSSNITFERAVAPSPWSLPSHASIFTGDYPHEHGMNRLDDPAEAPLVQRLSADGYSSYGVSANGFLSPRTGFHEDFDAFRYTGGRDIYTKGLDVAGTSQDVLRDEETSKTAALKHVLANIPRHPHPLKSALNVAAVACGELSTTIERLQKIPHPAFAPTSDYSYRPQKNTGVIRRMLADHPRDEPFFLFTNYMDTHRCYTPDGDLQEKHIGRRLNYGEIRRLNEAVASSMGFETQKVRGELDEDDIADIRGLYAGEVETVDDHLRRIYDILEAEGLLDDTLVIVTADHGENLGETDEVGRRRMGHESSVSDAVLRVPLVIAHPELDATTVEEEVSLERLYDLCLTAAERIPSSETIREVMVDSGAKSQYPATGGGEERMEKYPEVPEEIIQHRSAEHSAVIYEDGWRVVAESTGFEWAAEDGDERAYTDAPNPLVESVEKQLAELETADGGSSLSEEGKSQLEDLGYL